MADVDFSHAVLDAYSSNSAYYPMVSSNNLLLKYSALKMLDINATEVTSNMVRTTLTNTPTKVSILFSGSFNTSGTEFYLIDLFATSMSKATWKVSNISFSSGDTYSFIIDIETSGN